MWEVNALIMALKIYLQSVWCTSKVVVLNCPVLDCEVDLLQVNLIWQEG
jgi:hypothetical protein